MSSVNKIALLTFCTALLMAGSAAAKPGDAAKGKGYTTSAAPGVTVRRVRVTVLPKTGSTPAA